MISDDLSIPGAVHALGGPVDPAIGDWSAQESSGALDAACNCNSLCDVSARLFN